MNMHLQLLSEMIVEVGLSSLLDSFKQVPDVVAQAVYGLSIGYYSERKECGYVQARKNRVWEENQSGEQIRRKTVLWKKVFSQKKRTSRPAI